MSYSYLVEKPKLFTEEGQVKFLKVRDRVHKLLKEAGSFTMGAAIAEITGDSWEAWACVDRMVELGEIREVTQANVPGQYRVFVAK